VMTTEPLLACPLCGRSFKPRQTGGKRQRYCSLSCRRGFDSAVRTRGRGEVGSEQTTVPGIGSGAFATRALAQQHETRPPVLSRGIDDAAHPDGSTRFVVEIPRSLIEALIFVHHALGFDQRDDLREILYQILLIRTDVPNRAGRST